jgi:hypothetical protein
MSRRQGYMCQHKEEITRGLGVHPTHLVEQLNKRHSNKHSHSFIDHEPFPNSVVKHSIGNVKEVRNYGRQVFHTGDLGEVVATYGSRYH